MKTPTKTLFSSVFNLKMERQHTFGLFFFACVLAVRIQAIPCGTKQSCNCWGGNNNIVSCANKGMVSIPPIEEQYRIIAETLILDGNQLSSMMGLDLDQWPSLKQLWVRNNPRVCPALKKLLVQIALRGIKLIYDCSNVHGRRLTTRQKELATTEKSQHIDIDSKTTPPSSHIKLSQTSADKIHIRVYGQETQTVAGYGNENTTIPRTQPIVDVTFDYAGASVNFVIPISMLGIASIIITCVWKRNTPKKLDVDVGYTKEPERVLLGMGASIKEKTSPTPSQTSETLFHERYLRQSGEKKQKTKTHFIHTIDHYHLNFVVFRPIVNILTFVFDDITTSHDPIQ